MTAVEAKKVVSLAFVLKDTAGNLLDEAPEAEPLVYLHGQKSLPAGIEAAVDGMKVGDRKEVDVAAKDAWGVRDDSRVEKVARHRLGKKITPRKGDMLRIETDEGTTDATILAVTPVTVTLDLNHPLAGKDIKVSLHVVGIREASEEEIAHGHAHGADGHGHAEEAHDHDHAGHDHDHSHGHDHDHK